MTAVDLTPEALNTIEARATRELPGLAADLDAGKIYIASNWLATHTDYEPEGIAPIADLLRGATPKETLTLVTELRRLRTENEAVRVLHQKTTRYTREDATGSFGSIEDLNDWEGDYEGQIDEFDLCAECSRIEAEAHENDDDEWDYIASAWPCPTSRAALNGEATT